MLDNLGYRQVKVGRYGFLVDTISGRVLPDIRGGAEGDDDGTPPEPKTFTQAEVDRIAGAARAEARRTAANELAAELGCTIEEARAAIEAKAAADDAAKTDADRARDQAETDRQAAAAERAEAARERFAAKVERRLVAAGVGQGIEDDADGKKRDAALARAARLIDLQPDADDDAIAAEIDALKADVPALFTSTESPAGSGRPPAPKPPVKPGGPSTGAKTMAELGRETLAKAGLRPRDAA